MNTALLLRIAAKAHQHHALHDLLIEASRQAHREPSGIPWFALRFRHFEFGIFAAFVDDTARNARATDLGIDLLQRAEPLLAQPPAITTLDVLASKMPNNATIPPPSSKAMLLTFDAKADRGELVADFLRDSRRFVLDEPETTAWFAIRDERENYGIFDVFPDNRGRLKHFAGHIPRELVKHGRSLIGSMPDVKLPTVLAENIAVSEPLSTVTS